MNKEERIQYVLDNIKDNVAVNIALSLVEECDKLQQENKQLIDIIDELEKWLKSEIKRIEDIKNPKHSTTFSPKPYGREKEYYEIMINSYKYCLDKLKELEKGSDR